MGSDKLLIESHGESRDSPYLYSAILVNEILARSTGSIHLIERL